MRIFVLLILLVHFLFNRLLADSIHVLFVYGSKPKTEGESHWFGGKHGGHVSIGYKKEFISFVPGGTFHIFPKSEFHSEFITETEGAFVFDTVASRYMLITIPVSAEKKKYLDSISDERLKKTVYDYAFFGFRCASSSYEMLSLIGLVPKLSHRKMIRRYFYPKLLRKELLELSLSKGWKVVYREGRKSRKWEND